MGAKYLFKQIIFLNVGHAARLKCKTKFDYANINHSLMVVPTEISF